MWNDTRDCTPRIDGFYLVQMIHGGLEGLNYTREGGWNTRYVDGTLSAESAIKNSNVAMWFDAPTPPEVSNERFFSAMREGATK